MIKVHLLRRALRFALILLSFSVLVVCQDQPAPDKAASDKPSANKSSSADKSNADKPADSNVIEFGVRYTWGDVYGRPDLRLGPSGPSVTGNPSLVPGCLGCGTPFDPLLRTSKYEEYRDLRNGFFVRKVDATFDNLFGSKYYVAVQSQKTLYRDQSYLATFGQYGKFKVQFRYDQIPHVYSNTTRTYFVSTAPGVWSYPSGLRSTLQASTSGNLPSLIAGTGANALQGLVTDSNFITPSIIRKAGTISASYDLSANLNLNGLYWRESQNGTRPIGEIMNSSPSASATSGFGVELPETISYFNNLVRVGGEYGKHDWAVQAAFEGSFLEENIPSMTWDNPFILTQPVGSEVTNPLTGRSALYPSNQAYYFDFAAAANLGKYARLQAVIRPGWLRQNDAFLPYTSNNAITGCGATTGASCSTTASLPTTSLEGNKQTLAMNYTLVSLPWKSFQIKASYRHYDYNNNTPVHTYTPTEGDAASPVSTLAAGEDNTPFGFNRKNFDLTANWFFAKKSSVKAGYLAEWMDRSHRDVEHSLEHTFLAAVDVAHWKDLLFRASYRHSVRDPDEYQDENSSAGGTLISCNSTSLAFTGDQRCSRRFDESHRVRDRADALVEYDLTQRLSLTAFGGTIQDDYNQRGGVNSDTALNFLVGSAATTSPYYLYGILKDISYNYGFDADFVLSPQVSLFAEYSREHNYRRMISRNRTPPGNGQDISTCAGCDTANNDWESTTPEKVDIWTVGADTYISKKAFFTTYYSLSAGHSDTFSRFLGINGIDPATGVNCSNSATTSPCRFLLVGTSAAVSYPESVSRTHEVVAIFKYKLTRNVMPKFEFRYQQFDNKDFQTSPMTQYLGCMTSSSTATPVSGCPVQVVNSTTSPTPVLSPNGGIPFYPYFQVGDTSSARYLFLGVDQPSYKAYYVSATIEFHF
jgi:MtrB/PioB family decaheme-associated outer membrane protein